MSLCASLKAFVHDDNKRETNGSWVAGAAATLKVCSVDWGQML